MSETAYHLIAGGCAGTVGAILTSPLEVIKTRLQSSVYQFFYTASKDNALASIRRTAVVGCMSIDVQNGHLTSRRSLFFRQPLACFRDIVRNEGVRGLFKGLTPTLIGVAPTRAVFFFAYQNCKSHFGSSLNADDSLAHFYALHGLSASIAGFTSLTMTNPIWLVKTRLQLDSQHNSVSRTIGRVFRQSGIRGFYKGITASYLGIAETVIHIVVYEELKRLFIGSNSDASFYPVSSSFEMFRVLAVSATSKTIATSLMYPHEVLRTRLRQDNSRYRSLRQTIPLIWREEGWRAFYRGLTVHIFRQVPNAAITMSVYELVVSCLKPTPENCAGKPCAIKFSWPFKSKNSSNNVKDNVQIINTNDSNTNPSLNASTGALRPMTLPPVTATPTPDHSLVSQTTSPTATAV